MSDYETGLTIITRQSDRQIAQLLKDSGLFDDYFYLNSNPDVAKASTDPLMHYLLHGSKEWRDPNPLFDTRYYVESNPQVDFSRINPLAHYIQQGAAEGRDPHPLFDTKHYLKQHSDHGVKDSIPLRHCLQEGTNCLVSPHPLFDTSYYLEQDKTVAMSGLCPLVHYLLTGAAAGLNPHPSFSSSFYLEQNPDVREEAINPLLHYVMHGKAERRLPYNEFLDCSNDVLSEYYPALCRIEPLLPAAEELPKLRLRKSLTESRAGAVYFHLANALDKPFTHLVLLGTTNSEHRKECEIIPTIARHHGKDSLIVISPDVRAKASITQEAEFSENGIRFFGSDWFPQELTLPERLMIVLRIIFQAAPQRVYDCDSQVAKIIFREHKQQVSERTEWSDCRSCTIGSAPTKQTQSFNSEPVFSSGNQELPGVCTFVDSAGHLTDSEESKVDISFVINCHAEGMLLKKTFAAASLILNNARESQLEVECLVVLDRADELTQLAIDKYAPTDSRKLKTDFGDSGLARNAAIQAARGRYLALMDGDDLLSPNWLVEAYRYIIGLPDTPVVLHPFGSIFFGEDQMVNIYHDSDDSNFSHTALMEDSVWLTNGFARRTIYLMQPYSAANQCDGFDFEDWQWNCETIASGIVHKMVPNTFFCYRVKPAASSKNARAHSCLLGRSSLFNVGFMNHPKQRKFPLKQMS